LVSQISQVLWNFFLDVMKYLEEVRSVEEIPSEQGSFANTPFTIMTTSKDYNVNIHKDMDDYGWSFIIWMGFEGLIIFFFLKLYFISFLYIYTKF
jgi:hypothetical protein